MSQQSTFFKFPEDFDPQDQKEYTFRFRLRSGESITSAVIDAVDSTSTTVLSPSPFVFGPLSFGVISGTLWGVTQWLLQIASNTQFTGYLRCKVTTDYAAPIPHICTKTMRLFVSNQ